VQVGDAMEITRNQMDVIHASHEQIIEHFHPNMIRQMGPASRFLDFREMEIK
jgi:hypothetical protein